MSGRLVRRHDRGRRRAALRRANLATPGEASAILDGSTAGEHAAAPEVTASVAASLDECSSRITAEALLAFARESYAIRRRRDRHLPGDLFGQPTWENPVPYTQPTSPANRKG